MNRSTRDTGTLLLLAILLGIAQHLMSSISVQAGDQFPVDHVPVDRVYWQAHRGGGTTDAPDNTMAAFLYTWKLGGIPEADIHTTSDGVTICIHDNTLARTTTALKELSRTNVRNLTFDEIRKWDAGEKFKPEFKGERVPSLEEVFLAMQEKPGRQVYLDIKAVDLKKLGELIDVFGVNEQVLVASPRQSDCQSLKKITTGIRTMIWIGGSAGDIKRKFTRVVDSGFAGVDQVQLHLHDGKDNGSFRYQLGADFLKRALQTSRKAEVDLEVFPFKFDDSSLHGLLYIGIRWFATDEPRRFTQSVKEWPKTAQLTSARPVPGGDLPASDVVLDVGGFEDEATGEPPANWKAFHATRPSVRVVRGGAGSRQSIRGQ